VRWNIVNLVVPDGGVGVKELKLLLSKLLWRLINEMINLWSTLKFGEDGFGWYPSRPNGS